MLHVNRILAITGLTHPRPFLTSTDHAIVFILHKRPRQAKNRGRTWHYRPGLRAEGWCILKSARPHRQLASEAAAPTFTEMTSWLSDRPQAWLRSHLKVQFPPRCTPAPAPHAVALAVAVTSERPVLTGWLPHGLSQPGRLCSEHPVPWLSTNLTHLQLSSAPSPVLLASLPDTPPHLSSHPPVTLPSASLEPTTTCQFGLRCVHRSGQCRGSAFPWGLLLGTPALLRAALHSS